MCIRDRKQIQVKRTKDKKLDEFQNKLATLTFLDPACGSGNFLTETYLSLRRLENEVIRERVGGQMTLVERSAISASSSADNPRCLRVSLIRLPISA